MDEKMKNKKGQIAIWVILAVVLMASIILFFALERGPFLAERKGFNPEQFIKTCTSDAVIDAAEKMLPQGGFIAPTNFKLYSDIKVAYLCENVGYFKPCINQHPMLINEIRDEIKNYIQPKIEQCFKDMKTEAEKEGNSVEMGAMELAVSVAPKRIYVDISRKVAITQEGSAQAFEKLNVEVIHPLYDLASVAVAIASEEAKNCYFEYVGYMILYPQFRIEVNTRTDSTRIYTITDKNSGKVMNIAIRGCAISGAI
jgi:hypothetical protein